jgi:hypothetical protein
MKCTITSRKLGREVTFSRPGSMYTYADLNDQPGTLGRQICSGGRLTGSTVTYRGDDESVFAAICRNWFQAYLRREDW